MFLCGSVIDSTYTIRDCNLRAGDLFVSDVTGNAHVITADTNRQTAKVIEFGTRKGHEFDHSMRIAA